MPWLYRSLAALGRVVFPWEERVWTRCEKGLAAGLYLKLNPRFEIQFACGAAETTDEVLPRYLFPGSVFYDIGSHIGYFAVGAARWVGSVGKVYAFEPDPTNARLIVENAARNSLAVEVVEKAVWKRSGEHLTFARAPSSSAPSRMGGRLATKRPGGEAIGVQTVALDEFVNSHLPPTLIKIDVEGAEVEVLEGARTLLERFRPVVLVEIHSKQLCRQVAEILVPSRYDLRPVPPDDRLWLAVPDAQRPTQSQT